eukprot:3108294-Pyramimonas_sp.AAC.1
MAGDLTLNVATFNAMSMIEDAKRQHRRHNAKLVRQQFRDQGIQVLGIQEARTREGTRTADGYYILASGGDGKNFGVEACFSLTGPYLTPRPSKVLPEKPLSCHA